MVNFTLPGGFSPTQAAKQIGDTVNPFNGKTDYNVFRDYSVSGGDRNPVGSSGYGFGRDPSSGSVLGYSTTVQNNPQPAAGGGSGAGAVNSQQQAAARQQVAAQQAAQRAAANAEAARINNLRNQIGLSQQNAVATGQSGVDDYYNNYRLQGQNAVNSLRTSQDAINSARENTALNTRRGIAGVTNTVRQGLQSGGVQLANMNALDSGAADALGRAYSTIAQQEAAGVYNEAALQNRDTDLQQVNLDRLRGQQEENLRLDRDAKVNAISNQLYNDLRTIDTNAVGQGINGAVNYGLRDNVINSAIARLNQLDQARSAELGGIQALSQDQVLQNAIALDQAGATAANQFATVPGDYGIDVTGQSGAPISQLPIYTRRRDI